MVLLSFSLQRIFREKIKSAESFPMNRFLPNTMFILLDNRSLLSLRTAVQSPVLRREEERLRAETTRLTNLKEQLETTIENARLTEFNDAPVLVRVDRAPVPEKRHGPPRALIVLGTIMLAATLIFWVAFVRAPRSERW